MKKYRLIMRLALDGASYRDIHSRTSASYSTISKLRKVLDAYGISSCQELDKLDDEQLVALVGDGRGCVQ